MANPIQPFDKLFKQYLFSVSAKFIGSADKRTQADLIKLISRVDGGSPTVAETLPEPTVGPSAAEWEWQQVLDKPVDWQSVHSQWLIGVTRQRIIRQEAYIAHVDKTIQFTQHQSEWIKNILFDEPSRSFQLNRNTALLKQYQGLLTTACTRRQNLLNQLSRLADV